MKKVRAYILIFTMIMSLIITATVTGAILYSNKLKNEIRDLEVEVERLQIENDVLKHYIKYN